MRFTLLALAVLPSVLSAAVSPAASPAADAAANGTITPFVDTVVKILPDVSCSQPELERIRPDCGGACHAVPAGFGAFKTNGNGVYGVNCHAYSDTKCSPGNYLGQTGNHVSTSQQCFPFSSAHSYICYYKC